MPGGPCVHSLPRSGLLLPPYASSQPHCSALCGGAHLRVPCLSASLSPPPLLLSPTREAPRRISRVHPRRPLSCTTTPLLGNAGVADFGPGAPLPSPLLPQSNGGLRGVARPALHIAEVLQKQHRAQLHDEQRKQEATRHRGDAHTHPGTVRDNVAQNHPG
ncbi:uncharacterized protein Tco025E_04986, partial [Trypanosoma conorhini]